LNNSRPFLGWNGCIRLAEVFLKAVRAVLLISLGVMAAGAAGHRTAWYGAEGSNPPASATAKLHYASLPLAFEQNRGQSAPAVKFLARGSGFAVFLTNKEAVLSLERSAGNSHTPAAATGTTGRAGRGRKVRKGVLRLRWAGANAGPKIEGLKKETGNSNYLVGNDPSKWVKGVPSFSRVEYQGLYPGVDLVYYGNRRELEFDIDVAPGADLSAVRLQIAGEKQDTAEIHINAAGELVAQTRAGGVRFRKPVAYQPGGNSVRRFLGARYVVAKAGQVGFEVSGYDRRKPLVIDPVLSYSTYLGGTDYNYATGIAVDVSGNTYITGYTSSVDFPIEGGVQGIFAGGSCDTEVNTAPCFDAFVAKLNPTGTGLVYSTYLGGTGDDEGVRIAVDSSGQAYVAGFTDSNDFPTAGPLQGSNGGGACGTTAYPTPCYDAFVAKLAAAGSNLVYSTYLGGTGDDFASSIAADANGNAYVAGLTSASNFPVTYGTLQTGYGGGPFDGFVAKINPTGSSLVYSTYLGGTQEDHVNGIALDASGDAFLTGQTNSSNFPVKGGFQPKYTASSCGSALSNFPCFESFVSELNPTGTALVYSSYLGGTAASYGSDIALDSSAAAYVAGWTTSKDFPVTQGAYDTAWGGTNEIFVAKIAAGGGAISYATYLGDIFPDQANAIAVDGSGNAWVAGFTYSGKFPVVSPLQAASGGTYDAIVSEFNPTGSSLLFSTYLGGTGNDAAGDLALDASGNVYVTGATFSTDFPITPSAMTSGYTGGSYDAWIAKIGPQNAAGLTAEPNPLVFTGQEINTTSAPSALKIGDAGSAALSLAGISVTGPFRETSQCGQTVAPGTPCTINVTFTPTATGTQTGTLVINDNAAGSPQTVRLSGWGTSGAVSLSASSLDFGPVVVGTTSTQTATLTNPAASPLDISSIQTGGDYLETNNCGSVVNQDASCNIAVTFSPSSLGTSVGTVTITDTGLGSPQTITLSGTGTPPFWLSANPISETVLAGTATARFTVSVSSTAALTGSIALGCANVTPATCAFIPSSIVPGQSSTLTVGNLNAVTSSALNFNVTGTATTTTSSSTTSSTTSTSGAATATLALSVQFSDFTLAASPASDSVQAGQTAKYTLTVTPLNGFDMPVSLACSGVPKGATCSFSSSTVQEPASGSAQATLSVHTTARSLVFPPPSGGWPGRPLPCFPAYLGCAFLALALLSAGVRRHPLVVAIRAASLALLICLAMAACGGGAGGGVSPGTNNGTPAGTYALTITATAQSLSHTSQVTVQVQ
jgi:Beta-propeller repeat/Cep192 domain 4